MSRAAALRTEPVESSIPYQIDDIQQIFHVIPSVVTDPNSISGPRTGFGDLQLYNFSLTKFALPQSQALTVGAGPFMAFPTVNSPNSGPGNTLQGGAAAVIEARLNWGILGVLATYQHTLSGAGSQLATAQPILYYNFQQGWYFRSDAIWQFNTYSHTNVVPVGFGFGKVIQTKRLHVERLCRSPTLRLSQRAGRARPPDRSRHPGTIPGECDERLEVLKSRNMDE